MHRTHMVHCAVCVKPWIQICKALINPWPGISSAKADLPMAVDRKFYVYRFGRPQPGWTHGRADNGQADDGRPRPGGRAAGPILNDGATIVIDFHKKHQKTSYFSVVSRPGQRTDGRTGGRADDGCLRPGGRAAGPILNDSTTIFIDFHKKHPKTLCFSVVSRPAEAQVPIFTAQMKKASKKCQKSIVFFDFSNHAGAQVPIFTPKMKKIRFAELARFARPRPRKWDFRRRSQPRELAQRSQDDVSLNKLP